MVSVSPLVNYGSKIPLIQRLTFTCQSTVINLLMIQLNKQQFITEKEEEQQMKNLQPTQENTDAALIRKKHSS